MNKKILALTAGAVILSGFSLNAKDSAPDKKNFKHENSSQMHKEFQRPHFEPETLTGTITVNGSEDNQLITLTTQDKKTFVLTTIPHRNEFPHHKQPFENSEHKDFKHKHSGDRAELPPQPGKEIKEKSEKQKPDMTKNPKDKNKKDKQNKNNSKENFEHRDKRPEHHEFFKPVSAKDLKDLNEKTATVKGFLNKETSVFTVFGFEN